MSNGQTPMEKAKAALAPRPSRQMTKQPPQGDGPKAVATTFGFLLEKAKPELAKLLSDGAKLERLLKVAYNAVTKNPKLLECEPVSLVYAVREATELCLEVGGILGHAYLVPYWNHKTRRLEAQMQVGYRGLIELANRSGRIKTISAEIVYETDTFELVHGLEPKLVHIPDLDRPDDAKMKAVYAIAHFKDGGVAYRVLGRADVERARASSSAEQMRLAGKIKDTPWTTHYGEMARKTAVRALAKYLPLTPELTRAAVIDEVRDNKFARLLDGQMVIDAEAEPSAPVELPAATETDPLERETINPETGELFDPGAKPAEEPRMRQPGED
jgi:recombination protein RecT